MPENEDPVQASTYMSKTCADSDKQQPKILKRSKPMSPRLSETNLVVANPCTFYSKRPKIDTSSSMVVAKPNENCSLLTTEVKKLQTN